FSIRGSMGLKTSSGPGATTRLDLGTFLTDSGCGPSVRGSPAWWGHDLCLCCGEKTVEWPELHMRTSRDAPGLTDSFPLLVIPHTWTKPMNSAWLENIFLLSVRKKNKLRVDMEDWEGGKASAQYSSFLIDNETAGYRLHLGGFTGGAAGDSFSNHNNMKFTTFDKDQDNWDKNCAQTCLGGFWYNSCHMTNPTGMYAPHGAIAFKNVHVIWHAWKDWNYSLKTLATKIRSVAECECLT
ncbi:hypothetical protein L3Q82_019930, partial [Scortum barcoo]